MPLLSFIYIRTLTTMLFLLLLYKAMSISDFLVEQMMWSEFVKGYQFHEGISSVSLEVFKEGLSDPLPSLVNQ